MTVRILVQAIEARATAQILNRLMQMVAMLCDMGLVHGPLQVERRRPISPFVPNAWPSSSMTRWARLEAVQLVQFYNPDDWKRSRLD